MKSKFVFLWVLITGLLISYAPVSLSAEEITSESLSLEGALAESLYEPVVEEDDTLSTGQVTEWCCVTFGAYPQTEIVSGPSAAVDSFAVQEGDFLEDPALYEQLVQADWTDDRTQIEGVRYLRMNQEDAVSSASDRAGHYRWGEEKEWHYFRFDPIRWRVIALEGTKACLLSDRLLDCRPFQDHDGPVTWETSGVRSWLNNDFLDMAFSSSEQAAILKTQVANDPNPSYGTDCGNDTEDYVFLLSNNEVFASETGARNGFYAASGKDDPAKRFRSTMYAKCRGAWWSSVEGYKGNSFWFMRTSGYTPESVTYICDFGYIYRRGTIATCEDAGLLTALWIDLEQAQIESAGTVSSKDIMTPAGPDQAEDSMEEEDDRQREKIVNPVVEPNPDTSDGKEVTYSLIAFGSYPQTEIVPEASQKNADSIVDEELYAELEKAGWQEDEWEYNGQRYLRVLSEKEGEEGRAHYFVFEPLLWRVLEVSDGTALVLSHRAVECEPFQEDLADVSWENCSLRSYLNGYGSQENVSGIDYSDEEDNFLDIAFTPKEQEGILEYPVRNEANYYFGMDSGNETTDKIFIPAESELFVYDSSVIHGFSPRDEVADLSKQFYPTDYALNKGVWHSQQEDTYGHVFWITRTTGYTHANVVYVDESGYMYNRGILVTCSDAGILPAMVLDLDSAAYAYAGTYVTGEE